MKFGTSASKHKASAPTRERTALAAAAEAQRQERQGSLMEGAGDALTQTTLEDNKAAGRKARIEMELSGITGDRYEQALNMEKYGYQPPQGKMRGLLELLNIPGNLTRLALLELDDSKLDKEIPFWKTARALAMSDDLTAQKLAPDFVDDDGDVTTRKAMEAAGWERGSGAEGVGQATVGFLGDVLSDPLSYVSFGSWGVAKPLLVKAANNVLRQSVTSTAKQLVREAGGQSVKSADSLVSEATKRISARWAATADEQAKWVEDGLDEFEIEELTTKLWDRVAEDAYAEMAAPVLKATVTRSWKEMPEWFAKSGTVAKDAPFLRGGAQFVPSPLGGGLRTPSLGGPIPGTVGLGRAAKQFLGKAVPAAAKPALKDAARAANPFKKLAMKMDQDSTWLEILKQGEASRVAGAMLLAGGRAGARLDTGVRDVTANMDHAMNKALSKMEKLSAEDADLLSREMVDAIQSGVFEEGSVDAISAVRNMARNVLDDDSVEVFVEMGNKYRQTMDFFYKKANELGMELREARDYLPLIFSEDFGRVLRRMADEGVGINFKEVAEMDETTQKGYHLLAEVLASMQHKSGKAGTVVGDSRFTAQRSLGQNVKVLSSTASLFDRESLGFAYRSHQELEEALFAAAQHLAGSRNMSVKFDSVLDMNPISIMSKYMGSMGSAIEEAYLLRKGFEFGLWKPKTFRTDAGRLLTAMQGQLDSGKAQQVLEKKLDDIVKAMNNEADHIAGDWDTMVEVDMGVLLGRQELPKYALRGQSPKLVRKLDDLKRRQRVLANRSQSLASARTELTQRLVAKGVPEAEASAIAALDSVKEIKSALRQAAVDQESAARELAEELLTVVNRFDVDSATELKQAKGLLAEAKRIRARAAKADAKAKHQLAREVIKTMRASGANVRMTFADEVSRKELARRMADDVADAMDAVIPEDMVALSTQLRAAVHQFVEDGDTDAIRLAVKEIKAKLDPVLSNSEDVALRAESLRGLAEEGLRILKRDELIDMSRMKEAMALPSVGETTIFDSLYQHMALALKSRGVSPERAKLVNRVMRDLTKIVNTIEDTLSAPDNLWQVREWATGTQLFEQLTIIEKIAKGHKTWAPAMRAQLVDMLSSNGLLGEGLRLQFRGDLPLGFQIVEDLPPVESVVRTLESITSSLPVTAAKAVADDAAQYAKALGKQAGKAQAARRFLQDRVLAPMNRANPSFAEALAGLKEFKKLHKATIPQADRGLLDVLYDQIARHEVLRTSDDPVLRRFIDANNAYREAVFDPEVTAKSFQEIAASIARDVADENLKGSYQSLLALAEMDRIFREVLGYATDADGKVNKVFLDEADDKVVDALLDKGKRIWERLGLDDGADPFNVGGRVPTAEADGFVDPAQYGLFGAGWDSAVGDQFALEFMRNATAQLMAVNTPEGLNAFTKVLRGGVDYFKTMATVVHFSFHINNLQGGILNATYADTGLKEFAKTAKTLMPFLKAKEYGSIEDALDALDDPVMRTVYRYGWDHGLFESTFASSEHLDRTLKRFKNPQRNNPFSRYGPLAKYGGKAMAMEEAYIRMSVFMRHFDPNADDLEASARYAIGWVNATQFDYANLTQLELGFKGVMPFFVWFRRNLPLQMNTLLGRPKFMQRYQYLMNNLDNPTDRQEGMPTSIYGDRKLSARLGETDSDSQWWQQVIYSPNLPIAQLFELDEPLSPTAWGNMLVNQLGPQFDIGAALTGITDQSYYKSAPGGISQILNTTEKALNALPGNFGLPGVEATPEGVARVRPWAQQLAQLFLPLARDYGGAMLEQRPTQRQGWGQAPASEGDDSILSDARAQVLSMFGGGVGVRKAGVDESYDRLVSSSFDFNDMIRELKKRGEITPDAELLAERQEKLDAALAALRDS